MNIEIQELICKRCGHNWIPRQRDVSICPKCKSPYWNKEITRPNAFQKKEL